MRIGTLLLLVLLALSQLSCGSSRAKEGERDVTSMATPRGGKLKPAEDGPVRSALGQPEIELDSFELWISGLVDSSFSLTWEEMLEWPSSFSDTMIMYCVEGWEVWGSWKGILVRELLEKAHLKEGAAHVMFQSVDGYSTALPISYITKYDVLLAYEVNGNRLEDHDGFPLRLIAFGKYGYKWAKWVSRLEIMAESRLGHWETRGYDDRADVPLSRRRYYEGEEIQPLEY